MSIVVDAALNLTVRETLDTNVPAASRCTVVHDAFNKAVALRSTTTPPVTKVAVFQKALVAGVATIDLRALVGTNNLAVDGNGLKVQAIKIQNPGTNTNVLAVVPGASNGYNLFGASAKITLNPGEEFVWLGIDNANVPNVDATHKTLDLSDASAGGTESSNWVIVLG
jgi:hypothetical protein